MDTKLTILKTKLQNIFNDLSSLSKKIEDKSMELDITLNFEDISDMLTQNRRGLSRAKQHAAEIAQITQSGQSSDIDFRREKDALMYKSELTKVCIGDRINPGILNSSEAISYIGVELKNMGVSHKWGDNITVSLECLNDASINKIFSYYGQDVGYGKTLEASFIYDEPIDISGKEKILLNFIIMEGELIIGSHTHLMEVREV